MNRLSYDEFSEIDEKIMTRDEETKDEMRLTTNSFKYRQINRFNV